MAGIELIRNSKMEYVETWVDETTIDFWFAPEQECFRRASGKTFNELGTGSNIQVERFAA